MSTCYSLRLSLLTVAALLGLGASLLLRPTLSRPLKRDLALPRLLQAIQEFWSSHDPMSPVPSASLYGIHSCKSTLLAWGRQLSLPASLRRIQGHHRLSGAQQSEFQRLVVQHIRSGFRPLQPMSRGASAPLPDFPVTLPPPAQPLPASLPVQSALAEFAVPAHLPVVCASPPLSVGDEAFAASASFPLPSTAPTSASPGRPQHPHDDADSVDSVSSASADSGPSDAEPCPDAPLPASDSAPPQFLLYNHRSNVLHAAIPADPCFLSTVGKRVDGRIISALPVDPGLSSFPLRLWLIIAHLVHSPACVLPVLGNLRLALFDASRDAASK